MSIDPNAMPKVLRIYLEITRYPILARTIREKMREELFARRVVSREVFEQEVREKALQSRVLEGLTEEPSEESPEIWRERMHQIRESLTDFYFAYNIPHARFAEIVEDLLKGQKPGKAEVILSFNPELAPWDLLFAKAQEYEGYPENRKETVRHHLQEIIVVLVKGMISDQLDFVGIAKNFFTIGDLKDIFHRRIGRGKIGGKAAGMMLAHKILRRAVEAGHITLEHEIDIPDSYFIGADVYYEFHQINTLHDFHNQKYKSAEQISREYPAVVQAFTGGRFPEGILARLRELLERVGHVPLIVRSSSLLEDNFGGSFAGKYDSYFCPNQGSDEENLDALADAVKRVYASVLNPSALVYRRRKGLIDYDERMAVLIQAVEGNRFGDYHFPSVGGVALSRNPFRWEKVIRREDGLLRMVFGLGTRAVDRVAHDYPRMVALSHPQLRPERTTREKKKYSQHSVDVLNLATNHMETLLLQQVLTSRYPGVRLLAAEDKGDYVQPIYSAASHVDPNALVLTFDGLVNDATFVSTMKMMLQTVEQHYGVPVDMEFAIDIAVDKGRQVYQIHLLQCRRLALGNGDNETVTIPGDVPRKDIVFSASTQVPYGRVADIEYIVYIDPRIYAAIESTETKHEIGRVVGRLNKRLEGTCFILMGPGRWGSSNISLGVGVTYADIFNTRALVEIAMEMNNETPEVSYGTHFFQDLVESHIYPLPLYPDDESVVWNNELFDGAPNALAKLLPADTEFRDYVKVIDVRSASGGRLMQILMDGDREEALAYFDTKRKEN